MATLTNETLYDIIKSGVNYYDPKEKMNVIKDLVFYYLDRFLRLFKYKNLPDTITERVFKLWLFTKGSVFFTDKYKGEYHIFYGGLGGEPDVELQPTQFVIANPHYSAVLDVKEDGVLIRCDTLSRGLMPLLNKYATALTENELSLHIADIMARAALVFTADGEEEYKSAENYIKQLVLGDLSVIISDKLLGSDGVEVMPGTTAGYSAILPLIEHEQYLKGSLYNDMGLNANWNAKREAIGSNESALNEDYLNTLVFDMFETQKECLDKVNEKYGLNITVEYAGSLEENEREKEAILESLEDGEEDPEREQKDTDEKITEEANDERTDTE